MYKLSVVVCIWAHPAPECMAYATPVVTSSKMVCELAGREARAQIIARMSADGVIGIAGFVCGKPIKEAGV